MEISLWVHLLLISGTAIATQSSEQRVELALSFVEYGTKCVSGVQFSSLQQSTASCVLLGISNRQCHAVNFHPITHVCELVISHGSVLKLEHALGYIFVAFNKTYRFIETDTSYACQKRGVQWRKQLTRRYVTPSNPVYTDNTAMDRYVCKATVGDNELPGVLPISGRRCKFILHERISFAEFYLVLILDETFDGTVNWWLYNVGDIVPYGAFIGGQTDKGMPLYVCRVSVSGVYFSGYYDPSTRKASIHSGSLQHPAQVELLAFVPHGPVNAALNHQIPCPRPYVRQSYSVLEWVEHFKQYPKPRAAIISGTVPRTTAVGSNFIIKDTIAKLAYNYRFCTLYEGTIVCNEWGKILVSSVPYEWVPFVVGSTIPNNAVVSAHTVENDPLYIIMKDTLDFAVGQYDPDSEEATIEWSGSRHPSTVHILTIPECGSSYHWTDKGFNTKSGPITAMRIKHGDTITGIQSRFGGQWSIGFWLDASSNDKVSQLDFKIHEYVKGIEIGLHDAFRFIKVVTNLKIYGPFGVPDGVSNRTILTRCGHVEFFSGQLCWNETARLNSTLSLNVHGQICT